MPNRRPPVDRPVDGLDRLIAVVITFALAIALWFVVAIAFGLMEPPELGPNPDDPLDRSAPAPPALALHTGAP